jgi:gluconokinase
MASGTGLLDGRTLHWDASLLRRCGVDASRLSTISDAPSQLAARNLRRFPELSGVPWYPAIGDGAASNLGSGAVRPGLAAINVGTSAALRVVIPSQPARRRLRVPLGLFCYRLDTARSLVGGAVSNAGNLRAWALRELNLPPETEIERQLATRTAPARRLTLLPFWIAERAPTWPEEIPSVVTGISQGTTALDLLQALQEATYHRLAQIAELVEHAGGRKLEFVVSGGIRRSAAALQCLANVLGRPVHASAEPEASLRGAACFALERLGIRPPTPALGRLIRPEAGASRLYRHARLRQMALEKLMHAACA